MEHLRLGRPLIEHNGLQCRQPLAVASRNFATLAPDRLANRDEVRVTVEAHVDALDSVPELREAGIDVQIHPDGRVGRELSLEQARDVDKHVGRAGPVEHLVVRRSDRPL